MSNRYVEPNPQEIDAAGLPYAGAFLYFYLTGTSTPTDTYLTSALNPALVNTNPIVLDTRGAPPYDVFLDPAVSYKVVLKDSSLNTIRTTDPVVDLAANVTAAIQVYAGNPNTHVAGNAGTVGGSGASVVWDITNSLLYICTTTGAAAAAVWTQQGASLVGQLVRTGVITPTALAANTDDWNPTGLGAASVIRLAASAAYNLTGIVAQPGGTILVLENIGAFNVTLVDDSTSTAANRFQLPANTVLAPDSALEFRYDDTSSRWRPTSLQGSAASDTLPGGIEIAVQSEMETGTDVVRAVVPGRQQFHPGHPKCWAFVTVSAGTPTLAASHNITSITDDGVGLLTITIATDFSSASWAAVWGAQLTGGGSNSVYQGAIAAGTVSGKFISATVLADPTNWSMAGFGDQA